MSAGVVMVVPPNKNPGSVQPLAFKYPIHRRRYLRTFIQVDHSDNPAHEWPYCLAMDPELPGVKP